MMRKLLLSIFLLVFILSSVSWAATYYIDYNAVNDSANGTSKSTPWKRHPYMVGFTGSYVHSAGDQFIFKGGVTWTKACFPMAISSGGSTGNVDYYGVDLTWYTGASWTRPSFSMSNISTTDSIISSVPSYVKIESIRVGDMSFSGEATGIGLGRSSNIELKDVYCGPWTQTGASSMFHCFNSGDYSATGGNRVADGITCNSGTVGATSGQCFHGNWAEIKNSTMTNLCDSMIDFGVSIHDNIIGPMRACADGTHPDVLQQYVYADNNIYNNLIYDIEGAMIIFVYPGNGGHTTNIFNNVVYTVDNYPIKLDPESYSGNTVNIYGNTLVATETLECIHVSPGTLGTLRVQNNHCVQPDSSFICVGGGCGSASSYTENHNFAQTNSQATAQGYISSNQYKPTDATDSTVNAGTTITCSFCGSAINSDILGVSRPQGSAWDIGAYEFSGSASPSPPRGLMVFP